MSARVGIVVRTVDRPEFLARALTDIVAQTFTDWQVVVVVDGGDRDAVEATVTAATGSSRMTVVEARHPGGRCAAANTGVDRLDCEFIVLHDDDDYWDRQFLERTVDYLDTHPDDLGVGVATAIVYEERRGAGWVETARAPFWADLEALRLSDMLATNRAVPISMLYRRKAHELVGPYDEELDAVEDWEFYLRVLAIGTLGFLRGEPLAFWTQRPGVSGPDGNSMFVLQHLHGRDDAVVRERELKGWVTDHGAGLPLFLADMERRIREDLRRELTAGFELQRVAIRAEIDAHQPVWSRIRSIRRNIFDRGRKER